MKQKIIEVLIVLLGLIWLPATAQDKERLEIVGHVFENIGKTPLQGMMVRLLNAKGTAIDSRRPVAEFRMAI